MQITGSFQISDWQESTEQAFDDGCKRTTATVAQTYDGQLQGTSQVHYQMHYGKDGNAEFNGFEYVTGALNGRSIELVIKHAGVFEQGVAKSQFEVISSSSAEISPGVKGVFHSTQGGRADYQFG